MRPAEVGELEVWHGYDGEVGRQERREACVKEHMATPKITALGTQHVRVRFKEEKSHAG